MKKLKNKNLWTIILINVVIFGFVNLLFDIKYEQVDDFIIYNLYSGLDGTYNIQGVYFHPIICILIGFMYRIIPIINWHSVFLLGMQFICFTIIGFLITEKNKSKTTIILYTIFASVFYTSLLLLIQYTSVSALLILTAFFMTIYGLENNKKRKLYWILSVVLYTVGIMARMESLLIILPFFLVYGAYYFVKACKKKIEQEKIIKGIKICLILIIITGTVYVSNYISYNSNPIYKEYMEYNKLRVLLHDLSYTSYDENKELFEEIGWSENDHYLFYTFNFGDENVYSKENLQKIVDYKKSNNEYYNLNLNISEVFNNLKEEMINSYTYISILFITIFLIIMLVQKENRKISFAVFITTIMVHLLFIVLNRSMLRVVIPEYILGTTLLMYYLKSNNDKIKNESIIIIALIFAIINFMGSNYNFGYELDGYNNYKQLIKRTNQQKENVYLYTVPSLQYRYLAYSVYEMPPQGAFSNLRVMGGWDMFTENYYDFKERYNLSGTFLDVLKENVYVIDGDVNWSGNYYTNYIDNIVLFIKENYNIDVTYEKVEEFDNLYIYKMKEKI